MAQQQDPSCSNGIPEQPIGSTLHAQSLFLPPESPDRPGSNPSAATLNIIDNAASERVPSTGTLGTCRSLSIGVSPMAAGVPERNVQYGSPPPTPRAPVRNSTLNYKPRILGGAQARVVSFSSMRPLDMSAQRYSLPVQEMSETRSSQLGSTNDEPESPKRQPSGFLKKITRFKLSPDGEERDGKREADAATPEHGEHRRPSLGADYHAITCR